MSAGSKYTLKWLFFGLSGRIRRKTYILSAVFFVAIYTYLVIRIYRVPEDTMEYSLWGLVLLAVLVVSAWSSIALSVKRLHDLGFTGFVAIAMFIPMVSFLFFMVLCVFPGQEGPNRFGQSPITPDS
jgi:uncharacterized membrane protein YhaH (DUF805 family)